jgi:heme A synthase
MWRGKYWAVLGFQILLGIAVVYAGLSLLVASNVAGAVLALAIMVCAGTLFWFLVRSLARLQMPRRPGDRRLG